MSCRYQVRIFETVEPNGPVGVGTTVRPAVQTFSVYAYSADEAEKTIRNGVASGKFARGRVYQLWPFLGNGEFARSLAIGLDGSAQRVFLDPVDGPYSEFRRIRLPRPAASIETPTVAPDAVPA